MPTNYVETLLVDNIYIASNITSLSSAKTELTNDSAYIPYPLTDLFSAATATNIINDIASQGVSDASLDENALPPGLIPALNNYTGFSGNKDVSVFLFESNLYAMDMNLQVFNSGGKGGKGGMTYEVTNDFNDIDNPANPAGWDYFLIYRKGASTLVQTTVSLNTLNKQMVLSPSGNDEIATTASIYALTGFQPFEDAYDYLSDTLNQSIYANASVTAAYQNTKIAIITQSSVKIYDVTSGGTPTLASIINNTYPNHFAASGFSANEESLTTENFIYVYKMKTPLQLLNNGSNIATIKTINNYTYKNMVDSGITVATIRQSGVTIKEMTSENVDALTLYNGGASIADLHSGGVSRDNMIENTIPLKNVLLDMNGHNSAYAKTSTITDNTGGYSIASPASYYAKKWAVSPSGNFVIIGNKYYDPMGFGSAHGQVRVFKYDSGTSSWSEIFNAGGIPLVGADGDFLGASVDINDYGYFVVGATGADGDVQNSGSGNAEVFVYDSSTGQYAKHGTTISGEQDLAMNHNNGWKVSLTNTSVLADLHVAVMKKPTGMFMPPETVRVYSLNGATWTQVGAEFTSISDFTLCQDSTTNDVYFVNKSTDLKVYKKNGSSWSQLGSTFTLQDNVLNANLLKHFEKVCLSSYNGVLTMAYQTTTTDENNVYHTNNFVDVKRYDTNTSTWINVNENGYKIRIEKTMSSSMMLQSLSQDGNKVFTINDTQTSFSSSHSRFGTSHTNIHENINGKWTIRNDEDIYDIPVMINDEYEGYNQSLVSSIRISSDFSRKFLWKGSPADSFINVYDKQSLSNLGINSAVPVNNNGSFSLDKLTNDDFSTFTNTQKKRMTRMLINEIFDSNTSATSISFNSPTGLPGFANTANKEIKMFPSSKPVITNADIGGSSLFYLPYYGTHTESYQTPTTSGFEEVYIDLPTQSGSLRLDPSTAGLASNEITINSYDGAPNTGGNLLQTVTHNMDNTFTFDGLTLIFGSILGQFGNTIQSVDILFTHHLDESIDALSLSIPTITPVLNNIDATVIISGVPVNSLCDTFYFKTDAPIATDATDDVLCYVDTSKWATITNNLDASTGSISVANGAFVDADVISKDFLRNVANGLFGTHLGVDLFTNETTVRQDLETKTATLASAITTAISDVGISGGDTDLLGPDADGHKYLDDTVSDSKNVTLALLMQFLQLSPDRFNATNLPALEISGKPGYFKIPFQAGDSVSYAVTINPDIEQNNDVNTGTAASARKYRVKLMLA